jgi:predicted MPP superfamily phosphohydrolase
MPPDQPVPARRMTRRTFLSLTAGSAVATAAAGIGGYAYLYKLEPDQITVEEVELALPRLPHAFEGLRLVQISDLHLGKHISAEHLHETIDRVNAQEPCGRDHLITSTYPCPWRHRFRLRASRPVRRPSAAEPRPPGQRAAIRRGRRRARLRSRNTSRPPARQRTLHLCGLDDHIEHSDLDSFQPLPTTGGAILLVHEPDYADISALPGDLTCKSPVIRMGQCAAGIGLMARYGENTQRPLPNRRDAVYTNRGIGLIHPRYALTPPESRVPRSASAPDR